jgi:hypothetical protein
MQHYTLAGFEPGSSVLQADAMTAAPPGLHNCWLKTTVPWRQENKAAIRLGPK